MKTTLLWTGMLLLAAAYGCSRQAPRAEIISSSTAQIITKPMTNEITKPDAAWRQELTAEQYRVLREKGTERPFTGKYWDTHAAGDYTCAGCGLMLFKSEAKFDSGCGWPSFSAPAATNAVATKDDTSFGMHRIEVLCPRCGGHLGHVFDDGPAPTGLRYCINSASLNFAPAAKK